jgi:TctA family transporter
VRRIRRRPLSGTSLVKTLAMAAMGIALGTVGTDVTSGTARFD